MHEATIFKRGLTAQAIVLGLFAAVNGGLPMYLWQDNAQVAVACSVVLGYTVWLWAATAGEIASSHMIHHHLKQLPMNAWRQRVGRMLLDGGFWWSMMFGCTIVAGSAWYVGVQTPHKLAAIAGAWALIAVALNYGLTMCHPTTRCRRCAYQLAPHLEYAGVGAKIRCPECGAKWNRTDLGLAPTAIDAVSGMKSAINVAVARDDATGERRESIRLAA